MWQQTFDELISLSPCLVLLLGIFLIARRQLLEGIGSSRGFAISGRVFALRDLIHNLIGELARLRNVDRSSISEMIPTGLTTADVDALEGFVTGRLHLHGQ